ncbi:molybdenum cofactor biosysynthesis protein [Saccharospirillum sp. MSK14-1]|uniref:MOSC domain-containing protein n=1 Tax=Saccharospirillum sp. MSK14-1 TaxID=1897632 RepID=UPI000D3C7364|nr:MOSC domain-containing protein [Saccharospirillum sp. MSK14-1]PTY37077.1 molybdenum cofactor biosysynthesis protein [Saccharospirillum sp. MSK14-1]
MKVESLSKDDLHRFSKTVVSELTFIAGEGIEGDAHRGKKVQHRSRVKANPDQPNLRQVHLIGAELLAQLQSDGFDVHPATLGENVLTSGIDLLALPTDTQLQLGDDVTLRITGLRNPCAQLDNYQKGLTAAVLDRDADGKLIRKAGVMAVVETGGTVRIGDAIQVNFPPEPHQTLEPV